MQTPSGPEARGGRTKAESTPPDLQEENHMPKKSQGKESLIINLGNLSSSLMKYLTRQLTLAWIFFIKIKSKRE